MPLGPSILTMPVHGLLQCAGSTRYRRCQLAVGRSQLGAEAARSRFRRRARDTTRGARSASFGAQHQLPARRLPSEPDVTTDPRHTELIARLLGPAGPE